MAGPEVDFKPLDIFGEAAPEGRADQAKLAEEVDSINEVLWWVPADSRVKNMLVELVPQHGIGISGPGTHEQPDSPWVCPVTSLHLAVDDNDFETVNTLTSGGATVKFRMIYDQSSK